MSKNEFLYTSSLSDIGMARQIMSQPKHASVVFRMWLKGWESQDEQNMLEAGMDKKANLEGARKLNKDDKEEYLRRVFGLMMADEALKYKANSGIKPDPETVKRLMAEIKGGDVKPDTDTLETIESDTFPPHFQEEEPLSGDDDFGKLMDQRMREALQRKD